MHKFEYEIQLNDENEPYINIPDDYIDKPEDKFMALELTCYILQQLLVTRKKSLDNNTIQALKNTLDTLSKISEEVADLIKTTMVIKGETSMQINHTYHIQVNTVKERDSLNYNGIIRDDKIFKRVVGLRVLITSENTIYELCDGIDNKNWKKI